MSDNAVRMTGAMFIILSDRPGVTTIGLAPNDTRGNQLEVEFDVLPGRYRITVEEIETDDD